MAKNILVVDDSSSVRKLVEYAVKTRGFRVFSALDGQEGFETLLEQQVDLVILDINMPRMDGFAFLQRLRAHPDVAVTPVVMLTTEGQDEDKEKARQLGVTDYLVKPFKPTELLTVVEKVLPT